LLPSALFKQIFELGGRVRDETAATPQRYRQTGVVDQSKAGCVMLYTNFPGTAAFHHPNEGE